MPISTLAVIMTCFNRRQLTLRALDSLFHQKRGEHLALHVFLVDDGSTDGTGDAIRERFPEVHVLQGDGNLFWNGGMRKSFEAALQQGYDAYILFNDDVVLYPDALQRLLELAEERLTTQRPAIIVGSTCAPVSGNLTYGGFIRREKGPSFWFQITPPHPEVPISCDTMNGNFVLIPAAITDFIGNLEGQFRHMFGDLDYGLRARNAGFDLLIAPGFIGECASNNKAGTWQDRRVPLRDRLLKVRSPKGLPFQDWFLFTRRHYGWRFPLYLFSPYLKQILKIVTPGRDA